MGSHMELKVDKVGLWGCSGRAPDYHPVFIPSKNLLCDIDHRKPMLRGNTTCTRRNAIYNVQCSRAILDTSAEEIGKKNLNAIVDYKRNLPWEDSRQIIVGRFRGNFRLGKSAQALCLIRDDTRLEIAL